MSTYSLAFFQARRSMYSRNSGNCISLVPRQAVPGIKGGTHAIIVHGCRTNCSSGLLAPRRAITGSVSWTEEDARREEFYESMYNEFGPQWADEHAEELYRQHYDDAVKEFTAERLQSYYLKHPDMAKTAIGMLEEASALQTKHPNAALLFAASAVEITIKRLLVKPIVNGLIHNAAVAEVVMALTPTQTGSEIFKNLLFSILNKVGAVDLTAYKRVGSNRTLWDEWKQLQKARNDLIHDGVPPSSEILAIFHPIAVEFLNVVFPKVLAGLGLKVTGYLMIGA